MKRHNSLSYKIFIASTLVLFFSSLILYGFILLAFPTAYNKANEANNAYATREFIHNLTYVDNVEDLNKLIQWTEQTYNIVIIIMDLNHNPIAKSSQISDFELDKIEVLETTENKISVKYANITSDYIFEENSITYNGNQHLLVTASEISAKQDLIRPFMLMYPVLVAVILLQAIIISYIISRITIRPIRTISEKAHAITSLDFDNDYSWQSNDEFGMLSVDLDEVQEKMKQVITHLEDDSYLQNKLALEEQKQQIAILSHELNTPLTVLKMQTELMIQSEENEKKKRYLERNLKKVDEITLLVDDILNYKTVEDKHAIHVNSFIQELIDSDYGNSVFLIDFQDDVFIEASPIYLGRLLKNVLNNAIKYNIGTNPIRIVVKDETIRVSNVHHPKLNFNREQLFKPYVRANTDKSIEGQGLGLYICKRISMLSGYHFDVQAVNGIFTTIVNFKQEATYIENTIDLKKQINMEK
ncbi:HAMP domain-containing sensor histidine kinase [Mollicutes bacterium LVI A0078]|nr:HAMP domain-containing sensor histidine kinase [Mollicutes bacterium LVI A0075]WOO91244.1 HAMP domain-containing sensor histidine kinase [Mollicutes bacterium LVI A0078]